MRVAGACHRRAIADLISSVPTHRGTCERIADHGIISRKSPAALQAMPVSGHAETNGAGSADMLQTGGADRHPSEPLSISRHPGPKAGSAACPG